MKSQIHLFTLGASKSSFKSTNISNSLILENFKLYNKYYKGRSTTKNNQLKILQLIYHRILYWHFFFKLCTFKHLTSRNTFILC